MIEGFLFKLLVDDGAVVYVNGQEAFRDGFDPDTVVGHDVLSDSSGNESDFDEFEVNPDLFVEGENVIAIEVHNTSLGSNDMGFEMSLDAQEVLLPPGENPSFEWTTTWESGELTTFKAEVGVPSVARVGLTYRARVRHEDTTGRWSNWSEPLEFMVGKPSIQSFLDGMVISKIMYHPLPPSASELAAIPSLKEGDFEWIEIMNIGAGGLDLSNLRFTKGIEFDFVNGSKSTIAAGERLLVVANVEAFNLRHGFANTPDFVLGEFSNRLSNGGERVKLSFGAGTLVREVSYDDRLPWPESADGSGASLVWVDGFGEMAGDWRPSVGENGAPAIDDATEFTRVTEETATFNGPAASDLFLLAMKVEWNPDGVDDVISVYNVTDLTTEPTNPLATATVDLSQAEQDSLDVLNISETQVAFVDEVRIATTFGEAVGGSSIPEPSSLILGAMAGLLALGRRQR